MSDFVRIEDDLKREMARVIRDSASSGDTRSLPERAAQALLDRFYVKPRKHPVTATQRVARDIRALVPDASFVVRDLAPDTVYRFPYIMQGVQDPMQSMHPVNDGEMAEPKIQASKPIVAKCEDCISHFTSLSDGVDHAKLYGHQVK